MRLQLMALSILFLMGVSAHAVEVHSGKNGTYHLPEGLTKEEKVPVFIVEHGIGEKFTKFASSIEGKMKAIVVEMVSIRGRRVVKEKMVKRKMAAAIKECETHHSLDGCPIFPIGFSRNAAVTLQAVCSESESYSGVILVNAGAKPDAIPADVSKLKDYPVLILHGTKDPVYPVAMADAMSSALKAKGFKLTMKKVKTKDHMAPFSLAVDAIHQFTQQVEKDKLAAQDAGKDSKKEKKEVGDAK